VATDWSLRERLMRDGFGVRAVMLGRTRN